MKEKNNILLPMTIKELTSQLQVMIDERMHIFMQHHTHLKLIAREIEEVEEKMYAIISELEPVESLIYTQNPQLEKIFESLKRVYGKEEHGVVTEVSQ